MLIMPSDIMDERAPIMLIMDDLRALDERDRLPRGPEVSSCSLLVISFPFQFSGGESRSRSRFSALAAFLRESLRFVFASPFVLLGITHESIVNAKFDFRTGKFVVYLREVD